MEKSWIWSTPFDLIFARAMIASFSDWPGFIQKAYEYVLLKPDYPR